MLDFEEVSKRYKESIQKKRSLEAERSAHKALQERANKEFLEGIAVAKKDYGVSCVKELKALLEDSLIKLDASMPK